MTSAVFPGHRVGPVSSSRRCRAMSQDPVTYPQPDKFIPERFLQDDKDAAHVVDPEKFQFGFGRR